MEMDLKSLVLPNDKVLARSLLENYNFYSLRAKRAETDQELAKAYYERFIELVARKRENDLLESLKEYAIKMGITHVEVNGLKFRIEHVRVPGLL